MQTHHRYCRRRRCFRCRFLRRRRRRRCRFRRFRRCLGRLGRHRRYVRIKFVVRQMARDIDKVSLLYSNVEHRLISTMHLACVRRLVRGINADKRK